MLDVIIPTYGRPHRVRGIVDNIRDATTVEHRIVFAVEADDIATIAAVRASGLEPSINRHTRNYAGAVLTAYQDTDGDVLFAGADDLNFHPGWDVHGLRWIDGWVAVVGTNDLLNPYVAAGMHATHYFVARSYLDGVGGMVDAGPGSFLNLGYDHQYTDTEFIGTAKARARFRPCLESVVEHLHAYSGKGEGPDATTAKAVAGVVADAKLYDSRKALWWDLSR